MKKIDIHSHYFPKAYVDVLKKHGIYTLDGVPKPEWDEDTLFKYMDELDIERSVISLSSPHFYFGDAKETMDVARACNEYGADLKKRYPGKISIMASLPLPEMTASIEEIRYCKEQLGLNGIALQTHYQGIYLGSKILDPVMEALNKYNSVVVLHPTVPSAVPEGVNEKLPAAIMEYFFDTTRAVTNMIVNETFHKYPGIRFVIPHAGAFLTVLSDRLATLGSVLKLNDNLDVEGNLRNLYYDMAGISMPKQYELLQKITDDSHILYGSDAPFTSLQLCKKLEESMENGLKKELKDKIYYRNTKELLKL